MQGWVKYNTAIAKTNNVPICSVYNVNDTYENDDLNRQS